MKPRLLDLFSCAGGAAMGYHEAGFEVVGVDIDPQPNYPFEHHVRDALEALTDEAFLAGFAAIHASPTCQTRARVTSWRGSQANHPDTLLPTLRALGAQGRPWVVENVPEATEMGDLRADYRLCGTQFGLNVRRHRDFQLGNWASFQLLPSCQCYRNPRLIPFEHKGERAFADALGCTWMTNKEGRQAIPPAMTRFLGEQLMQYLVNANQITEGAA